MPDLPGGTVTFLFTDIEGSTRLWSDYPAPMRQALARHDRILRAAVERNDGYVVKTTGDGIVAAFHTAADALHAALFAQQTLLTESWPEPVLIKARMGLHTGAAESRDGDYYGQTLNRTARLMGAGHGGQVLLSLASEELVRDSLPDFASLTGLGEHRLKDLARPETVFQLLHPDLPPDFPPLRSLDNPNLPNNLPRQRTSFVGREKELDEIKGRMKRSSLLTLTGSGGCGKTRLSLQAAADVLEDYPDGVWFVELAPLSDPALVAHTVADALAIRETPHTAIAKTLVGALREKMLLLILDNCEHLLEASAHLADTVLSSCPQVKILVSSREALGVAGESAYRVPPLSTPDIKKRQTPESLSQYEAVHLFIERAEAVKADFAVTSENAPTLAQICHRLDGIPLALELAAARIRSMTIEELGTRLDDRFRILTGGVRTALPRQQTLRAMIDWSYDLLEESQKALLVRLAVFLGGWTLEGAEAVCVGGVVEAWEILELLTALCDKSLALAEEHGDVTRYRLSETVRQYGLEKLEKPGAENNRIYRHQHLIFHLALAEEAESHLRGPEQARWLTRLETEHDNLRMALAWCAAEANGASPGLRLSAALWRFWAMRGHISEGLTHLTTALSRDEALGDTAERASALLGAGLIVHLQCDYTYSYSLLEESLRIRRQLKDRKGIAISLGNLGSVACDCGDFAVSRSLLEESLAIHRELGNQWGVALALGNLGNVFYDQGKLDESRTLQEESLTIRRELGDTWGIALALNNLGCIAYSQGDYLNAPALYAESLTIRGELGDRTRIAETLEEFARLAVALGQEVRAARLWGAGDALRDETGAPLTPANRNAFIIPQSQARTVLGDEAFHSAWTQGRRLPMERAIAYALSDREDAP